MEQLRVSAGLSEAGRQAGVAAHDLEAIQRRWRRAVLTAERVAGVHEADQALATLAVAWNEELGLYTSLISELGARLRDAHHSYRSADHAIAAALAGAGGQP